jgi:NADPH:quinone reductase-like Zn-dependent oxidoreductase
MRAVVHDRYGSAEVAKLVDLEVPQPTGNEVLVRVMAASLNTADLDHLKGLPRITRAGTGWGSPKSRRVGLDVAGRVEAVGPDVVTLRAGDTVWADLFGHGHGSLAEYVCASEGAFNPIPAGVGLEQAATVPHSGVLAFQGLKGMGGVRSGDRVLINGAGGCVGPFAIQIAQAMGARVTGVDHTDKLGFVRSLGVDHAVDYTREDITRSGEAYDFVLDVAATRPVFSFRRCLGRGGRYVHIARSLRGFFAAMVVGGAVSLAGSKRMGVFGWAPNKSRDLAELGRLIETGKLEPVIDRRFTLEEAPQALGYLEDGRARGKVLIVVEAG